ncbi:hypothetical protein JJB11_01560 [Ramlibacter ginsenosidimutans]|uniref:Uncharacterized protein n=1 Tax=Ramlibacter ginsenosidimutans TaxID=502333 RepID=A0A934TP17_9BURK|nr:hypothetical protein [Ramlibacter ginsenosidimutans]MBK6004764.1 hypothetical protein [Ramlibacter ginsenosidimutans]
MNPFTCRAMAGLCATAMLLPITAHAQDADRWQFTGSLNLFLPTLSGTTAFPPPAGSSSASVDVGKILENLKFTFMGSLEARKGQWGAFTDLVYLDVGSSKSGTRALSLGGADLPAGVAADARYDLRGWSWTLGGAWRAVAKPEYVLDVIAGARLLDIQQSLDWTLTGNIGSVALPDRTGARESRLRNWDAIIGVKGRYALGQNSSWFMPYYLDVGTGNSDLTTQAMIGVGRSFGWGDVVGSWRYLGYNMKSGQVLKDLSFSGPMVSAVFHW